MRYAAEIMPARAPLPMDAQAFNKRPKQRARTRAEQGAFLWRLVAFGPAIAFTFFLSFAITDWFSQGGVSGLERAVVVLVGLTFIWISISVSTVLMGLVQRIFRPCRLTRTSAGAPLSVALLVPIYNEDPASVFGNASAMLHELTQGPQHDTFTFFVLSDTTDPEIAELEERAFMELRDMASTRIDIYYRRRAQNTDKKVGNLTDWIENWGGDYEAMLVLDADSLMSGAAIRRLAGELSAEPDVGLIQSVPVLVGAHSLFGRMQEFSNAVYGWLLSEGMALWAQGEGNYWGHNAIIRTQAFAQSARLPYLRSLRGKNKLILSHDFVEAGMLRRAGWRVRFLPRVGGSFEQTPQTLIDYALRDRRWCRGNLQHLRLLFVRGFHPMSRYHLLQGALAFLMSPFWFALMLTWAALGMMPSPSTVSPQFFEPSDPLYPIWSGLNQDQGWIFLALIYTMLLLPKCIGAIALGMRRDVAHTYGGSLPFFAATLFEIFCAIVYAPIMMVQQTIAVVLALLGRGGAWGAQARGVGDGYSFADVLRFHIIETVLGAALIGATFVGTVPLMVLPVAVPLMFAAPLSLLSAVTISGLKTGWMRLDSPQSLRQPRIVTRALADQAQIQLRLDAPMIKAIAAE
jgi:membrane glycosyltransferase